VHVGVAQNELNEVQNCFIIIILFNGILSYIRIKQFLKKWTYGRCDVTRYSEIRGTGFPMTSRWRHADMVTRGMCVVVVVIIHWRRRVVDGVATDWSLHHDWKHTRTNETRKSPSTAACQLTHMHCRSPSLSMLPQSQSTRYCFQHFDFLISQSVHIDSTVCHCMIAGIIDRRLRASWILSLSCFNTINQLYETGSSIHHIDEHNRGDEIGTILIRRKICRGQYGK